MIYIIIVVDTFEIIYSTYDKDDRDSAWEKMFDIADKWNRRVKNVIKLDIPAPGKNDVCTGINK